MRSLEATLPQPQIVDVICFDGILENIAHTTHKQVIRHREAKGEECVQVQLGGANQYLHQPSHQFETQHKHIDGKPWRHVTGRNLCGEENKYGRRSDECEKYEK